MDVHQFLKSENRVRKSTRRESLVRGGPEGKRGTWSDEPLALYLPTFSHLLSVSKAAPSPALLPPPT